MNWPVLPYLILVLIKLVQSWMMFTKGKNDVELLNKN